MKQIEKIHWKNAEPSEKSESRPSCVVGLIQPELELKVLEDEELETAPGELDLIFFFPDLQAWVSDHA